MDNLTLSTPETRLLPSYLKALDEGFVEWPVGEGISVENARKKINEEPEHFVKLVSYFRPENPIAPDGTPIGEIESEHLWISSGDEFIAAFNLRLELNEFFAATVGHVGYAVRPSAQGKGVASKGLALIKDRARDLHGMDKLLLTCDPENIASERTIIKNGGIFQDTLENPFGMGPTKRFWINLG